MSKKFSTIIEGHIVMFEDNSEEVTEVLYTTVVDSIINNTTLDNFEIVKHVGDLNKNFSTTVIKRKG